MALTEMLAGDVTATLDYLREPPVDDPATPMVYDAIGGKETTMRLAPVEVKILDGRKNSDGFSLDREGFTLVPHHCGVTDFMDRSHPDRRPSGTSSARASSASRSSVCKNV